ncbi:conserved hypothetical protein [Ricinus communis]|uniref:Uncharacterized protein n=1 Tax=Ricinus communis TaxID=3988 RepID=B9TDS8_RICCO|nr:conserved hypothetical protein [Ricinus communis]
MIAALPMRCCRGFSAWRPEARIFWSAIQAAPICRKTGWNSALSMKCPSPGRSRIAKSRRRPSGASGPDHADIGLVFARVVLHGDVDDLCLRGNGRGLGRAIDRITAGADIGAAIHVIGVGTGIGAVVCWACHLRGGRIDAADAVAVGNRGELAKADIAVVAMATIAIAIPLIAARPVNHAAITMREAFTGGGRQRHQGAEHERKDFRKTRDHRMSSSQNAIVNKSLTAACVKTFCMST